VKLPTIAAVAGAIFSAALLRKGVIFGPDSWAYWEGSVSILRDRSYSYFAGEPITSFPPLFSLALALSQAVIGVSVRTLAATIIVLVAISTFAWTKLYLILADDGRSWRVDAVMAFYVAATMATYAQVLLSETLWLALLPILLAVIVGRSRSAKDRGAIEASLAWLLLFAMLLCRNVTVALLPAVFLLWVQTDGKGQLLNMRLIHKRLALPLAIVGAALLPWYWVRRSLYQLANHPIGNAQYGGLTYVRQMIDGVAYAMGPDRWRVGAILLTALVVVLLWRVVAGQDTRLWDLLRSMLTFALLSGVGLVILFSLTYVGEPLSGRFVVFVAIVLALVLFGAARIETARVTHSALVMIGALLTLVAAHRLITKYRLAGREQPVTPLNVTITPAYWSGPPQQQGDLVLVAPPAYPWMSRYRGVDARR